MKSRADQVGGIIHIYQKYDPQNLPSPLQQPPDLVSEAFNHMLAYGNLRELSEEDLSEINNITSQIPVQGDRYSEATQRWIDR